MLKGVVIFALQIIFLALRVKNIRNIQYNKPFSASLTSGLIAVVGLLGTYFGIIEGLMEKNIYVIVGYVIGAIAGTYIAMKL